MSLAFCPFFISALIFFIAGKDDFGRAENKLIIEKKEKVNKQEKLDPALGVINQA